MDFLALACTATLIYLPRTATFFYRHLAALKTTPPLPHRYASPVDA
jgi:hypothetical protein